MHNGIDLGPLCAIEHDYIQRETNFENFFEREQDL